MPAVKTRASVISINERLLRGTVLTDFTSQSPCADQTARTRRLFPPIVPAAYWINQQCAERSLSALGGDTRSVSAELVRHQARHDQRDRRTRRWKASRRSRSAFIVRLKLWVQTSLNRHSATCSAR